MADVYLAVVSGPAGWSKLQVVKRLRVDRGEEPEVVAMFLDEARLAARLNHPNVVQTTEVGEDEGELFLVMEYLEGVPLSRVLSRAKKNPPPPGILLRIIADALAGLHYAHELKDYDGKPLRIVHRDASPHNIFVTYDGHTKLLDFGIAKATSHTNKTAAGTVKGKIGYMAPEQALAKGVDRRADIFAIGLVLWEILAGRRMWGDASDVEILQKLAAGGVTPIEKARNDIPFALRQICGRAIAISPDERYATAAEMRADLLAYLERSSLHITPEQVARYVGAMFSDKRAEIAKLVERQLGRLGDAPEGLFESGAMALPRVGFDGSEPLDVGGQSSSSHGSALRASAALSPVKTSSPRWPWVIVVAAFVAAAVGTFTLLASPPSATNLAAPPPAETSAAPPVEPPPAPSPPPAPAPAPAPMPAVQTIELHVSATPENAAIYLDDARLPSNPFTGKFPADGIGHRLHAELPGYRTMKQIVVFEQDATIDLPLVPAWVPRWNDGPLPGKTAAPSAEPPPSGTTESGTTESAPKAGAPDAAPWGF